MAVQNGLAVVAILLSAATVLFLSSSRASAQIIVRSAPPSMCTSLPSEMPDFQGLLGDLGNFRTAAARCGVELILQEQSEVLGNVSGGLRRGAVYEGATQLNVNINLSKTLPNAAWLQNTLLSAVVYQIHGRGLSANNLNNLLPVSGIEATRATRLYELWLEQTLVGKADQMDAENPDLVTFKLGQQGVDKEFLSSFWANSFISSAYGWPGLAATDMPSGGPAYPLSALGARLKYGRHLSNEDRFFLLGGVFNGDPAGPGSADPQARNASGTSFRLGDGVFAILEAQYNRGGSFPFVAKLGAWYNSQPFADQRLDREGLLLASPASSGISRARRNNYSIYAVYDQSLIKKSFDGLEPSGPGALPPGLGLFVRLMGAPHDRNLLSLYADAGLAYVGLNPRPITTPAGKKSTLVDTMGFAVSYARVGQSARAFDADTQFYSDPTYPVRDHEVLLELTYTHSPTAWLKVQPVAQYLFHPRGNAPDPYRQGHAILDAFIAGARATINF